MIWILAGAAVLALNGLVLLANLASGGSLGHGLGLPSPLPQGNGADFVLYGALSIVAFAFILALSRRVLADRGEDSGSALQQLGESLAVHGYSWPIPLLIATLAGLTLSLGGLRGNHVPSDLPVVEGVVLIALAGNYLTAARRPRPRAEAAMTALPPESAPPSLDDRIKTLTAHPSYQGQIQLQEALAASAANLVSAPAEEPLRSFFKGLAQGSGDGLFEHQQHVLSLLQNTDIEDAPRRALLITAYGSGTEATAVAAILRCAAMGYSSIVVAPDQRAAGAFQQTFLELTGRSPLLWRPSVCLLEPEAEPVADEPFTELLIATPATLHLQVLPKVEQWRAWLTTVDLVVVLAVDELVGVTGAHAGMVLRRLERLFSERKQQPARLGLGAPMEDVQALCSRVCGWKMPDTCVVGADGCGSVERRFILWQPGAAVDERPSEKAAIHRTNYAAEAQRLMIALLDCGMQPVLLTQFAPITQVDLAQFARDLAAKKPDSSLPVFDSFNDLRSSRLQFDCIVTLAFPADLHSLEAETRHLGRPPGLLVFVIAVPTANAQMLVRGAVDRETSISKAYEHSAPFVAIENAALLSRQALYAIDDLPGTAIELDRALGTSAAEQARRFIKPDGLTLAPYRVPQGSALATVERFMTAGNPALRVAWDFVTVDGDPVTLRQGKVVLGVIERQLSAGLAYPARTLNISRQRYQIVRAAGATVGAELELQAVGSSAMTTRINRLELADPAGTWKMHVGEQQIGHGLRFRVGCVDVAVVERVLGYHSINWLDPSTDIQSTIYPRPLEASFTTRALLLAFGEESNFKITQAILHALEHAVRSVLPFVARLGEDDLEIVAVPKCGPLGGAPALALIDYAPGGNGAVDLLSSHVQQLFELALTLLVGCPCVDGCFACLHLLECRERVPNEGLDKAGAGMLLALLLGRPEVRTHIERMRSAEVTTPAEADAIRRRIVGHVLPTMLGLTIPGAELAPMRLFDDVEKDGVPVDHPVDGLFVHEPRQVWIRHLHHARMVEVIAHEYAHNWEFSEGNLAAAIDAETQAFLRLLFIEGFASWVGYKVLDYYGFLPEKQQLEVFSTLNPQYPEGLRFFRHLESLRGINGPRDFMRNGAPPLEVKQLMEDAECVIDMQTFGGFPPDWYLPTAKAVGRETERPEDKSQGPVGSDDEIKGDVGEPSSGIGDAQ